MSGQHGSSIVVGTGCKLMTDHVRISGIMQSKTDVYKSSHEGRREENHMLEQPNDPRSAICVEYFCECAFPTFNPQIKSRRL